MANPIAVEQPGPGEPGYFVSMQACRRTHSYNECPSRFCPLSEVLFVGCLAFCGVEGRSPCKSDWASSFARLPNCNLAPALSCASKVGSPLTSAAALLPTAEKPGDVGQPWEARQSSSKMDIFVVDFGDVSAEPLLPETQAKD